MKQLNIGLIGFGNVGQGFVKVLNRSAGWIRERHGLDIRLLYIADPVKGSVYSNEGLDLAELIKLVERDGSLKNHPRISDITSYDVIEDEEVDVIVEVTPTNLKDGEPGYSHIKRALENEKHVITTNKGPISLYFNELMEIAKEKRLYLGIEGTVMSGTPLIKTLKYGLLRDIQLITGILNGTTNYILSKMEEGYTFDEALKNAQELGYAEADPSMDIDGWDLVAKTSILASLTTGNHVKPKDIDRKSLREYLAANQYSEGLKYVAEIDVRENIFTVTPKILDPNNPLYHVRGVENGVVIYTESLGRVMLRGAGAGRLETGYAVLTDLLDMVHTKTI